MTPKIFEIEGFAAPSKTIDNQYQVYIGSQTGIVIRYDKSGHQKIVENTDLKSQLVSDTKYYQLVNYWYLYYRKRWFVHPFKYHRAIKLYHQLFN